MLRDSAVSAEPESSRRVISEICRYNNASRFPPIVRAFFRHLAALNDRRIASARSADIFPDDFPARARAPPPSPPDATSTTSAGRALVSRSPQEICRQA